MGLSQGGNDSKSKNARVVFLVHDTLSQCEAIIIKLFKYYVETDKKNFCIGLSV